MIVQMEKNKWYNLGKCPCLAILYNWKADLFSTYLSVGYLKIILRPRPIQSQQAAYWLIEGLVATVVPQIKPAIQRLFLVDG